MCSRETGMEWGFSGDGHGGHRVWVLRRQAWRAWSVGSQETGTQESLMEVVSGHSEHNQTLARIAELLQCARHGLV